MISVTPAVVEQLSGPEFLTSWKRHPPLHVLLKIIYLKLQNAEVQADPRPTDRVLC